MLRNNSETWHVRYSLQISILSQGLMRQFVIYIILQQNTEQSKNVEYARWAPSKQDISFLGSSIVDKLGSLLDRSAKNPWTASRRGGLIFWTGTVDFSGETKKRIFERYGPNKKPLKRWPLPSSIFMISISRFSVPYNVFTTSKPFRRIDRLIFQSVQYALNIRLSNSRLRTHCYLYYNERIGQEKKKK